MTEDSVYVHAGPNCIAEYTRGTAATSPIREYVYGDEIDSLVMLVDSGGTRKLAVTRNQQWSVTALVNDANGKIVERYSYDQFGKRTVHDADGFVISGGTQYGNPYGYTSRRHDATTGLMHFRARDYDPSTGEFLTRDPLGYVDGWSLYRGYMGPALLDPFGLSQQSCGECYSKIYKMIHESIADFLIEKIKKMVGKRIAKTAAKAGVACLIDGPLPIGDAVGAIWTAWSLTNLGLEVKSIKTIMDSVSTQIEHAFHNYKFPGFWDCVNSEPKCCECTMKLVGNIVNEIRKIDFKNRPFAVVYEVQLHLASGMPVLAKCCRSGMVFTRKEYEEDWQDHCDASDGTPTCDNCGEDIHKRNGRIKKGDTISPRERNLDHKYPRARGGCGRRFNAQWLCFECNLQKRDKLP